MNALRFNRTAAVYGIGAAADEVAHFGIPLREQRLLAAGRAIADLSAIRILTLTGPDRLTWLNSITSQKLDDLAPGTSTETLVLSPTGHIEHWLRVYAAEDRLWLLSEMDTDGATAWLESMKFMLRVELTDVSADYQAVGTVGPAPAGLDAAVEWNDPWPRVLPGGASYAAVDAAGPTADEHPGWETDFRIQLVPVEGLRDFDPAAAGLEVAGREAWDALRIEAWRPGPAEVDHRVLVGEIDALRTAVHLAKGCYRGQEAVARVHNLGQVPRRLVFLHLDGSGHSLPDPGAEVTAEVRGARRPVGHVTSVALHHELGPIALALVKRTLAPEAPLQVAGRDEEIVTAAQTTIVAPGRDNRTGVPRLNRDVDARSR
ncbi:folate-binding protein [Brevibacterium sp. 91QC2O2]|uniref:CAF17-like 4Fe-4S cluster assembly/insertion protein YgfZ n=1 Tax=Brevibacterium sp. 91QC2O2 TaxID=2968458 RepID=UPI00211C861A|nr:glycine cleavage T C-terminal barrel domain-containing protein [Brevibacterium sp. 91QC2O2]MCQ9368924.1 folate-binding protein [Brevibacterium sp. 91QC2O2]